MILVYNNFINCDKKKNLMSQILENDLKINAPEAKSIKKEVKYRLNRKLKCQHPEHYKKSGDKKIRNFVNHVCIQPECLKNILMCSGCQTDKNVDNFLHSFHEKMQISDYLELVAEEARSQSMPDKPVDINLLISKEKTRNDADRIREYINEIKRSVEMSLNKNTNMIINSFENLGLLEIKNYNLKFKYIFDILDENTSYKDVEIAIAKLKELLSQGENKSNINSIGIKKKLDILQEFKKDLNKLIVDKFEKLKINLFSLNESDNSNIKIESNQSNQLNQLNQSNQGNKNPSTSEIICSKVVENEDLTENPNINNEKNMHKNLNPQRKPNEIKILEEFSNIKNSPLKILAPNNSSINILNESHISHQIVNIDSIASNNTPIKHPTIQHVNDNRPSSLFDQLPEIKTQTFSELNNKVFGSSLSDQFREEASNKPEIEMGIKSIFLELLRNKVLKLS